ncbi:MAG: hypothetical protein P8R42_28640 [Candidatus Binatia bacterium]|nr:hypothetical protein [Candidatus Binatia bacterium]
MEFPTPIRIATNGIELEVFDSGRGKPIVLCHGWPEIAYSWRHQMGPDFYIVHFNRQPGVADRVLDDNCARFLRNMYRTNQWNAPPRGLPDGMPLLAVAQSDIASGDPLMSDTELGVFIETFEHSGFTGGIQWYRNFSRNWEIIGAYEQRITQPTLMIYGEYDAVPKSETLGTRVPSLTTLTLPCGHWIQQELPQATNEALLSWLAEHYAS